MSGYTKLFSDIVLSTIWRESNHVRILWITMLAIKDRYHVVNASIPGLAHSAGISIEECEEGLTLLMSEDPYSRSQEFEGRRIDTIDGGWVVLNGEKYRDRLSKSDRNEYQRIKQKEYRDKRKKAADLSADVNVYNKVNAGERVTHTDTDTDTKEVKAIRDFQSRFWDLYGKRVDRKKCEAKWNRLPEKTKVLICEHLPLYTNATPKGAVPSRKNPLTYLNGECWLDEDLPVNTAPLEKEEEINWNKTVRV